MAADNKTMSVINFIQHYQRSILKSQDDEKRLLHCLEKLHGLQVEVAYLQATGVGRTVNALRKKPGPVGDAARKLVARWKEIVENHNSSDDEGGDDASRVKKGEIKVEANCDTSLSQSLSPSNSQEETSRKEVQASSSRDASSDEEMDYKQSNQHHHSSPPPSKKLSSRDHGSRERNSRERSVKREDKIHHHRDKNSHDRNYHEKSSHSRNKHEHSSTRDKNSTERKSHDKNNSSHIKNGVEHRNYDKHREHNREKSSSREKSSRERSHHSESPLKDSSKHKNSNEREKPEKSKERQREIKKEHDRNGKSDYHKSSSSNSSSNGKDRKSLEKTDKYNQQNHHQHKSNDKYKSKESKDKKSFEHSKKVDILKHIKKEPSYDDDEEHKPKKMKLSSSSKDVYKSKVKREPLSEDENDQGSSFADVLGAMDLPVPKFKKEDRKKIKTEPVEDIKRKIKIEEESDDDDDDDDRVGTSFEEALGFIDSSPTKSKSKKEKKKKSQGYSDSVLGKPLPKSEEIAAILDLPTINPNYRPLPHVPARQQRIPMPDFDPLSAVISNKTQRTKVYSGNKSFQGEITSLQEMCIKILQENIDALDYIGYAPYYLMEPVLARASAQQLMTIEYHNPHYMEDTDGLWETLVNAEFRGAKRHEHECWRDVYERSVEEREDKLGSLKAKIKLNNEARKAPQRTTKLAYVNSLVKPPRNVLRQQAKHGTSRGSLPAPRPRPTPSDDQAGPSGQQHQQSSHASTLARTVGMLREGPSMSIKSKKRPAPLMQKTLKFMKTSFRR